MSVDFPAPEGPTRTAVRCSEMYASIGSMPSPAERVGDEHVRAECDRLYGRVCRVRVGGEVGLCQHDHRNGSRIPCHRQFAFETAKVGFLDDRVDDEHDVDVGDQHLHVGGPSRDRARVMALARSSTASISGASTPLDTRTATQSPTAGRSAALLADFASRPESLAWTTSSGVATSRLPRSPRITRAGVRP